jgi:hypothetical protein
MSLWLYVLTCILPFLWTWTVSRKIPVPIPAILIGAIRGLPGKRAPEG